MRPHYPGIFLFIILLFSPKANAQCDASFNSSATSVCSGNTLNFINTSTGSSSNTWKINEVSFSSSVNSSYMFPSVGTFDIELVISDGMGCIDSTTTTVTVNQSPVVNISVSSTTLWASDSIYVNFSASGTIPGAFYYWDFCDGNDSEESSPFYYQWAAPGTAYCVCVELDNNNGCSDADCEINIVVNDDLAVTETEGNDALVYPNPSTGNVTISLANEAKVVTISDHLGRVIKSYYTPGISNLLIEDGELPTGIYFVRIISDDYEVVRQLVIE